jgi:hypothetical protein
MKFIPAFSYPTTTLKQGGHLDQVFVKNMQVTGAILNEGYYDQISYHKCLKVTLKIGEKPQPI